MVKTPHFQSRGHGFNTLGTKVFGELRSHMQQGITEKKVRKMYRKLNIYIYTYIYYKNLIFS